MNEKIINLIEPILPISYGWYKGEKETHCTFYKYNEVPEWTGDGKLLSSMLSYQIDLWGYTNLEEYEKNIKDILMQNEFLFVSSTDLFEADKGLYHKALRVRINKLS